MTAQKLVPLALVVAGVYFLWSAIKHAFVGGSVNVLNLGIGIACLVIGAVLSRKPASSPTAGG